MLLGLAEVVGLGELVWVVEEPMAWISLALGKLPATQYPNPNYHLTQL